MLAWLPSTHIFALGAMSATLFFTSVVLPMLVLCVKEWRWP